MDILTVLLIINAIFLISFGWPLARYLSRNLPDSSSAAWMFALSGVYVAECVAFSASMATNILGVCLAIVWGLVLRSKVRASPIRQAIRLSLRLSIFTCLPAVSFLSLLGPLAWEGWSLLAAEDGRRFGIPSFVPWPVCSLLGFFLTVSLSAVVLKIGVTTGIVVMLGRRSRLKKEPCLSRRQVNGTTKRK
jgi:hypothetical protein